jgi:hypothetical protein
MSFIKRLRVMWYAASQEWHTKTCGECGSTWMAIGKHHPELIAICDACEMKELERFQVFAEREWVRHSKEIA